MSTGIAYLRAGLDRLGATPTYATQQPTGAAFAHVQPKVPRVLDSPYVAPLLNSAIQRPHTMKVLSKKQDLSLVKHAKAPLRPTAGIDAHQGYGRHHKRGLALTNPIDGPLMPLADNLYAGLNNTIPLPA